MLDHCLATLAVIAPFRMGLKVIAVIGGAVVGFLLTGLLFSLVARGFFKQKPPWLVKRFIQVLGGIAVALAVYHLPIGFGTGFGFGGGGSGTGTGPGSEADSSKQLPETTKTTTQEADATKTGPTDTAVLRIEMLGGQRVKNERFYLLEGDNEPKTLAELRKTTQERQKQAQPLKGLEITITEHSVARSHPAVSELERWARQHDLTVTLVNK